MCCSSRKIYYTMGTAIKLVKNLHGGCTMYMVSACLAGINCRYDGKNTLDERIAELVREGRAIPLCPEVLGGLPTPRESCEIVERVPRSDSESTRGNEGDGNIERRVLGTSGTDHSEAYRKGAEKTLEICRIAGIDTVILQDRSPSCGFGRIYDGSFSGRLTEGNGVTAELLQLNGIKVINISDWAAGEEP